MLYLTSRITFCIVASEEYSRTLKKMKVKVTHKISTNVNSGELG